MPRKIYLLTGAINLVFERIYVTCKLERMLKMLNKGRPFILMATACAAMFLRLYSPAQAKTAGLVDTSHSNPFYGYLLTWQGRGKGCSVLL